MQGASKHETGEKRRIDHIVIAVRDLDEAGAFYGRLGFQVGTRNQHPWGTDNRLIQFGSSFIELIATGDNAHLIPPHEPRRFSFGAFIRDYLGERQGLAMLVLSSNSARGDAELFAESGIGDFETFSFERNGMKADGATTRVAFSLAFARDTNAPRAGFFVCQQHLPENFWDSRFQRHPNRSRNISSVALTTSAGEENERQGAGNYSFPLIGGRIHVCWDMHARQALLTSFTVQVNHLEGMVSRLAQESIPSTIAGKVLVIPQSSAFGIEIQFEQASTS